MAEKRYLDARQEAARIGCSVRTLERAIEKDGFPFIRFGRLRRFDPEVTDQYLAARTFAGRVEEQAKAGLPFSVPLSAVDFEFLGKKTA